ncbi:MAG TPA: ATP-binding cassette domain-containing protein [Tepidisphaeraceae bacterium]|jgi:osmoprotectant transport system ATP-binding protein|nr:ATP-binding cassette domain-containing protein [Tepidisphaeraceae bacterium]
MVEGEDTTSFAVIPQPYAIRFPDDAPVASPHAECVEVRLDGRWVRLNLGNYDEIFHQPGLYEQLFFDVLRCKSPKQVASLFDAVLQERNIPGTNLSVLEVGAGSGMVGEEFRRLGVASLVGIDALPSAKDAADRYRWGIYDDYVTADLSNLSQDDYDRMVAGDPNVMVAVSTLGFDEVPTRAFASAFNAIRSPGWLVFNIHEPFLNKRDDSSFARLIREMTDRQIIQIDASKRYLHRHDTHGRKIEFVAIVARKLKDLPDDLLADTSPVRKAARSADAGPAVIEWREITKHHSDRAMPALQDVNLRASEGELLAVVGESGAGKTTLLKLVNRLLDPTSGSVHMNDANVRADDAVALRRRIGYVCQGGGLFPHMTVAENIATTPSLLGWKSREIAERVDELLNLVGLPPAEYRLRRPSELSGGQQQRVAFARALAAKPRVLLLDEPFSGLDAVTRDALQREFAVLHRQLRLTSVMVTHDMAEALLIADRIAVMRHGRLVQVGAPHELMTEPADDYVATLIATPRRQAERLERLSVVPDVDSAVDKVNL